MGEMMNTNDIGDANVDNMLDALKQEVAVEDQNKLIEGMQTNTNQQYNYNPQQQQQQQQQQHHDPFLDQLKDL